MGRGKSKVGGGRGQASSGGGNASVNGIPALNSDLIRRANGAGTVVDYGDATQREYMRNVGEIQSMDLTNSERTKAINNLHGLTERQLEAEAGARSPYAMGMGPARFNQRQVQKSSDRAVKARQETNNFMESLRKDQRTRAKQKEAQQMKSAINKAVADGALSFTLNGKTWKRSSRRSKTFTSM